MYIKKSILIFSILFGINACSIAPQSHVKTDILINNSIATDVVQTVIVPLKPATNCDVHVHVHHQNFIGFNAKGKPVYEMQQHRSPCPSKG